jgi:hypothetical protein
MRLVRRGQLKARPGFSVVCRSSEQKFRPGLPSGTMPVCEGSLDTPQSLCNVQGRDCSVDGVFERKSVPNLFVVNRSLAVGDVCRNLEQFTFTVAHDLRGSTQLVTAYADLLATEMDGSLETEQLDWLNFIKLGATRIQDTIERGQAHLHELVCELREAAR